MEPGQTNWKKMIDAFGDSILNPDHSINRSVLGELVFGQPRLQQVLNEITHPTIRLQWQKEADAHLAEHPRDPVIVMIPLLYESADATGAPLPPFDSIAAIGCAPATQMRRLASRGLTPAQAQRRMGSQMPVQEKLARADYSIWNEGSRGMLKRQAQLWTIAPQPARELAAALPA